MQGRAPAVIIDCYKTTLGLFTSGGKKVSEQKVMEVEQKICILQGQSASGCAVDDDYQLT